MSIGEQKVVEKLLDDHIVSKSEMLESIHESNKQIIDAMDVKFDKMQSEIDRKFDKMQLNIDRVEDKFDSKFDELRRGNLETAKWKYGFAATLILGFASILVAILSLSKG